MTQEFLQAIRNRRSVYTISDKTSVPKEHIVKLVKEAVLHTPSSFHMQSGRTAILFGEHHRALWEIVLEVLKERVAPEQFPVTQKKVESFAAGYGTVLFFNDDGVVKEFAQKYPAYRENFPIWAQQSAGMLQVFVWTMLEAEGLGASLQHYNPLIDERVKTRFGIPESWTLLSQMPFGVPTAAPPKKSFAPIEPRVKVFA